MGSTAASAVLVRSFADRPGCSAPVPSMCLMAQTFLSAGFGDLPVPTQSRNTVLESTVNSQTGKSALQGRDALNRACPTKGMRDLCRALCRPTLSKMARNRTVRQSVRQRLATKWAEQMVLGQALNREGAENITRDSCAPLRRNSLRNSQSCSRLHGLYQIGFQGGIQSGVLQPPGSLGRGLEVPHRQYIRGGLGVVALAGKRQRA